MSFIAPQAYTKETLAKAFDWLQHQPAGVKQVATSPDVLVGLFLKAQRQGIGHIDADAPVSSRKFIDDLKNLKKDFAVFEEPKRSAAIPVSNAAPVTLVENTSPPAQSASASPTPSYKPTPMYPPAEPAAPSYTTTTLQQTQTIHHTSVKGNELHLDEVSLSHLVNIQQRFNLSSPQEALRMAISIGAQHIARWP